MKSAIVHCALTGAGLFYCAWAVVQLVVGDNAEYNRSLFMILGFFILGKLWEPKP